MSPTELEQRIAAINKQIEVHQQYAEMLASAGEAKLAANAKAQAQAMAAEVARLVGMRTPRTVARMEAERGLS